MRSRGAAALLVISGMLMMLLLAGVSPVRGAHGDPLEGPYGGALRVGGLGPISLNPFTATDATSWTAIPLVYDSVARIDPVTLEPTPWAAASWSISGSTLTVTLRSDLTFHDGSPVTAADVVYTYNQYKTAGRVPADLTVSGTGSTVTFTSATGGGVLYGVGLTLPIVKSGTANSPVGGGPWRPPTPVSMPLTLTANADHFWPPYLETVTFSQYADVTAAGTALLSGNLDFIGARLGPDDPGTIHVIGGENKTLLRDANLVNNPGLTQVTVGFNLDPGKPTSDRSLRVALAKLLDPKVYSRFYGGSLVSRSPIVQENVPWYNPDVTVYQVRTTDIGFPDLTESIHLLESAGYFDQDGDGYRDAPDGSPLSLTVVANSSADASRMLNLQSAVATAFRRLGLNVATVDEPAGTLLGRLEAGDFDAFVAKMDTALDPAFLDDYLRTSGSSNYFQISSATLDGYLRNADAALDADLRKAAVDTIQSWTMTEAFFLPQIHLTAAEATVRGAFEGWANMPGGVNNFWTYQNLHVAQVGDLVADLTLVPNSVTSGATTTAIARVFDQEGLPIAGATVTFWIGGSQVAAGTTGSAGNLQQSIQAPDVDGATDTEVAIVASKPGYTATTASAVMTVHPDIGTLSVSVASSAVTIASGDDATITATVMAGTQPVAGAKVTFNVIGIGGSVSAATGTTNAAGVVTTTFSGDVGPRTQFRIVATASLAGYTDGQGSTTIVVEQRVGSIESRGIPGLDLYAIVIAVIAIVVIAALAFWWPRRK